MTQANTPRRDGDAFQARQFWFYAADMLRAQPAVLRVGFESGPRGFDDFWVEYVPGRGPRDARGVAVVRDHVQCKWHASHGQYGFASLTDPAFINAETTSLLERALAAQRTHAPDGSGARFRLVSNWRPAVGDALQELVSTRSSAIKLPILLTGKTDASKMGRVRKAWREHLGIEDEALARLAGTLGFTVVSQSPEELRLWLNDRFEATGLTPVPISESTLRHDDIVFQWAAQGHQAFDAGAFRRACEREDLLGAVRPRPVAYGVKSFEHPIDRMEERCENVLDLVPAFHERFIRSDVDWATLYPRLQAFLTEAARSDVNLRLVLDAHVTLAFAAGSVLNVKSGCTVELEQRTHGRHVWQTASLQGTATSAGATLKTVLEALPSDGPDVVVAVGLTHDVSSAVRSYANAAIPTAGQLLMCSVDGVPGQQSVRDGQHAATLADELVNAINATRTPGVSRTIHLFIAAPNGFTFMAGQRQGAMGRTTLYEFDFGHERTGSYEPSLTLPLSAAPAGTPAPGVAT